MSKAIVTDRDSIEQGQVEYAAGGFNVTRTVGVRFGQKMSGFGGGICVLIGGTSDRAILRDDAGDVHAVAWRDVAPAGLDELDELSEAQQRASMRAGADAMAFMADAYDALESVQREAPGCLLEGTLRDVRQSLLNACERQATALGATPADAEAAGHRLAAALLGAAAEEKAGESTPAMLQTFERIDKLAGELRALVNGADWDGSGDKNESLEGLNTLLCYARARRSNLEIEALEAGQPTAS